MKRSRLDLVFRNSIAARQFGVRFFQNIIRAGLRVVGQGNRPVEISITLVGEQRMRTLNRRYRGKDNATDVLSFPLAQAFLTEYTSVRTLGDLFICLPYARRAAKRERIPLAAKLARLAAHGFLHLAGYDHERSARQARVMERLEQKILYAI